MTSRPSQIADHVMYCLPPETMSGIAKAYKNSWNSLYSNEWCNYVSAQMHEIGHNLNFGHSSEDGKYKDKSGMMGYSYRSDDGPIMCFNIAPSHSSLLGTLPRLSLQHLKIAVVLTEESMD